MVLTLARTTQLLLQALSKYPMLAGLEVLLRCVSTRRDLDCLRAALTTGEHHKGSLVFFNPTNVAFFY